MSAIIPIIKNKIPKIRFNATKEFSKYLIEFEIREHNYHSFKYQKMGKKKQRVKNEFLWYARWYFKEKPETGFLEVIYR